MTHFSNLRRTFGLATIMLSSKALCVTVGAYAVADHSICGISSIPGTIEELNKFFASPNYPHDMQKNFYWQNTRVRQVEWSKAGDYKQSTETSSGFDGADSSVLTYIASHGVTSSGVYKALAGSKSDGGCYMSSNDMELGNHNARYVILSTCQGLKIGSGYDPAASGENPSKTWKNAARGLNCIFGYSNNMADASEYGENLLAAIKDQNTPLSLAFMNASEAVSPANIPAVLCFGASADDAAFYLSTNKTFETQSRPQAASAWVFRKGSDALKLRTYFSDAVPRAIQVRGVTLNPQKIAGKFLGSHLKETKDNGITTYSSTSGNATFNPKTNVLTIRSEFALSAKSDAVPSVEEAITIAAHTLKITGLTRAGGELFQSSQSEDTLGGESGIKTVISRKISFKQVLAGLYPLGQGGSVDVTVGPGGAVMEVRASLVKIQQKSSAKTRADGFFKKMEDFETQAIQSIAAKTPKATFKVVDIRMGYDTGSFFELKSQAKAVVAVTVEASENGFARRYIEKFDL